MSAHGGKCHKTADDAMHGMLTLARTSFTTDSLDSIMDACAGQVPADYLGAALVNLRCTVHHVVTAILPIQWGIDNSLSKVTNMSSSNLYTSCYALKHDSCRDVHPTCCPGGELGPDCDRPARCLAGCPRSAPHQQKASSPAQCQKRICYTASTGC